MTEPRASATLGAAMSPVPGTPPPAGEQAPSPRARASSAARRLVAGLLLPFQTFLSACVFPRTVRIPVPEASYPARPGQRARSLVVMLPGMRSRGGDFQRKGFVALARRRGVDADLIAVDLHFGYYRKGIFARRLWEDVLAPEIASGRDQIWLLGISLGGSGALGVAREHPGAFRGVVLLSPYLGPPELAREIEAAGGLAAWSPAEHAASDPAGKFFRAIWKWLQRPPAAERERPEIYLGYGRGDRLAPSLEVLAAALPPGRVFRTEGGHDWKTWRALWAAFLSREELPEEPLAAAEAERATP